VQELHLLERITRVLDLHFVHADELRPVAGGVVNGLEHRGRAERFSLPVFQTLERGQSRLVIGLSNQQFAIELDRARTSSRCFS
jgi:hypothetical protein